MGDYEDADVVLDDLDDDQCSDEDELDECMKDGVTIRKGPGVSVRRLIEMRHSEWALDRELNYLQHDLDDS